MFVFAEIKAVKALAFFIISCFLTLPAVVFGANEVVWVLTQDHHLVRVNADKPQEAQLRLPIKGLEPGHALVGIDFRVSRGVMFACLITRNCIPLILLLACSNLLAMAQKRFHRRSASWDVSMALTSTRLQTVSGSSTSVARICVCIPK